MSSPAFQTPIVLCVYNRPHLARQVLEALRSARPSHMLLVADGPKRDDLVDCLKCEEVLDLFKDTLDWPVHVEWNVSSVNMGCRRRFTTGLAWAFDRVEEAIVLEDDCVPHPSFFKFCNALLEHYRSDPRVALISGSSFQVEADDFPASYFFSRYPLTWGWAGWRRTWELYDANIDAWERLRETPWLSELLADPVAIAYWRYMFDQVRRGFNTWDYSMTFSCWRVGALAVHPFRNLVRNIGYGEDATHTRDQNSIFANMPTHEMPFPLVHPDRVQRTPACDEQIESVAFSGAAKQRIRDRLRARTERMTLSGAAAGPRETSRDKCDTGDSLSKNGSR
jgi:glycosyltransferase involved in cell wall biosynthesis